VISRLPDRVSGAGARGPLLKGVPGDWQLSAVDNCAMQVISAQAPGDTATTQEETLNLKQTYTYFTNAEEPLASRPMRMDWCDTVSCGSTAVVVCSPTRPADTRPRRVRPSPLAGGLQEDGHRGRW
jgi:hypothetical protein